jgi:hypothetical protein
LHKNGTISTEDAYAYCNDPEEVEKLIATIEDKLIAASFN